MCGKVVWAIEVGRMDVRMVGNIFLFPTFKSHTTLNPCDSDSWTVQVGYGFK